MSPADRRRAGGSLTHAAPGSWNTQDHRQRSGRPCPRIHPAILISLALVLVLPQVEGKAFSDFYASFNAQLPLVTASSSPSRRSLREAP
jgi:hypothetical protein